MDITVRFSVITPGCCNSQFAVPEAVKAKWLESHETWYCPNCGKTRHYAGETDAAKFERMYRQKNDCCENLQEVLGLRERQIAGHKGAQGLLRKQRDDARELAATGETGRPE